MSLVLWLELGIAVGLAAFAVVMWRKDKAAAEAEAMREKARLAQMLVNGNPELGQRR